MPREVGGLRLRLTHPTKMLARFCQHLHRAAAAVDREVARADEDRARLQAVEAADRVAEMRRVGIADVLREMSEVEVLVGEVQEMPRALPGAEGAEGNA